MGDSADGVAEAGSFDIGGGRVDVAACAGDEGGG